MKRNHLTVLLFALTLGLVNGCSQAWFQGQTNFGVKQVFASQAGSCNNKVLITTGKVDSSPNSDGWSMVDLRTGQLVRVAGDAVIQDASTAQIKAYTEASSNTAAQRNLLKLIQEDGTVLPEPAICKRP